MSVTTLFKRKLGLLSQDQLALNNPEEVPLEDRSDYPLDENGVPRVPPGDVLGVFPQQGYWGNRIKFRDRDECRVTGWMTPTVTDGDLFAHNMNSGKLGVFRLLNVENCSDPGDMFFANCIMIGYLNMPDSGELEHSEIGTNTRFSGHPLL